MTQSWDTVKGFTQFFRVLKKFTSGSGVACFKTSSHPSFEGSNKFTHGLEEGCTLTVAIVTRR